MSDIMPWIEKELPNLVGKPVRILRIQPTDGGSINQAFRLETTIGPFFIKLSQGTAFALFEAEAEGLHELARAIRPRVPKPLGWGTRGQHAWLLMEYLCLGGPPNPARLGEALAHLHQVQNTHFGLHRANTIGGTPQDNTWHDDWAHNCGWPKMTEHPHGC